MTGSINFGYIFPGQGSQKLGMIEKYKDHPLTKIYISRASQVLNYDLQQLYEQDEHQQLNLTEYSQPAILVGSYILYEIFCAKYGHIKPQLVAGHSLGEYTALLVAGAFNFETAVSLVQKRGYFMQQSMPSGVGAMAAVIGKNSKEVEEICQEVAGNDVLSAANFNCPGQVVVAGHTAAIDRLLKKVKAIKLPVSVAFHCSLIEEARLKMAELLNKTSIKNANFGVVTNVDNEIITDAEDIRRSLIAQITAPVLWESAMEVMISKKINHFIEFGHSKVLGNMLSRISKSVDYTNFKDPNTEI